MSSITESVPGRSAELMYQKGLRRWRRSLRPLAWTCIPLGVVLFLIAADRGLLAALLSFLSGSCISIYLFLRDTPPEHVERWGRGSEGEKLTAAELEPLRHEGVLVRHDIETEWGNWDHVAVAPTGVYLIDTKVPSGRVGVGDDGIHVVRSDEPGDDYFRNLGRRMRGNAADVSRAISTATGTKIWVQAVVVLWAPFDEGVYREGKVTYVHGSKLRDWISTEPKRLKPHQYRAALAFLHMRGDS